MQTQPPNPPDFDVCLSAMICLTIFNRGKGDESETQAGEDTYSLTLTHTHKGNTQRLSASTLTQTAVSLRSSVSSLVIPK